MWVTVNHTTSLNVDGRQGIYYIHSTDEEMSFTVQPSFWTRSNSYLQVRIPISLFYSSIYIGYHHSWDNRSDLCPLCKVDSVHFKVEYSSRSLCTNSSLINSLVHTDLAFLSVPSACLFSQCSYLIIYHTLPWKSPFSGTHHSVCLHLVAPTRHSSSKIFSYPALSYSFAE